MKIRTLFVIAIFLLPLAAQAGTGQFSNDFTAAALSVCSNTVPTKTDFDFSCKTKGVQLPNGATSGRQTCDSTTRGLTEYNATTGLIESCQSSGWQSLAYPAFSGGNVTSSDGSAVLTIGAGQVTNAMLAGSIDLSTKVTGTLPTGSIIAFSGGDVTSSAGSATLTIGASRVTNAMLAGSIATSKLDSSGAFTGTSFNATTPATGFQLNGANGLSAPSNDSTAGATVCIGTSACAGQSGASASYRNVGLGYQTIGGNGGTLTTASIGNVALGYQVLGKLSSGAQNVGVGRGAAINITSGSFNMAIGDGALASATTTSANVAVGVSALAASATNTGNNVAIGTNSLANLTSGNSTGIGHNAGQFISTGSHNTAVGFKAMTGTTGNSITGADNTALGDAALTALQTNGADNTAFGYNACSNVTTGAKNLCIGSGATPPTATTADWLVFGDSAVVPALGGSMAAASGSNVTSCGTSPAILGNDIAGTITEGAIATGCVFSFNTVRAAAPHCVITSEGGLVFSYVVSASAFTITNVGALSSTKLDYVCEGQ